MKNFFKINHSKFLSLIIIINIIIIGLLLIEFVPFLSIKNISIKFSKTVIFFILFVLNITLLLFYQFFNSTQTFELNMIQKKMESLSQNLISLSMTISEISRGNMVAQSVYTFETLEEKIKKRHKLSKLSNLYNQISNYVQDSIQDINSITAVPCKRLIYVGADSFKEGEKCGMLMGNLLNGYGEVVVLLNKTTNVGHLMRYKGFKYTFNKTYPKIKILGVWEEFEDVKETYRVCTELIKKHPNLSGIYIAEGTTPVGAAQAIKDSGKADKIKIVTHDLTNPTVKSLEQGLINATLSQNPYVQGYNPIIFLYNYLVNKKMPFIIRRLTLLESINHENYKNFWSSKQGALISETAAKSLIIPIENTTSKYFKIAVILTDDKLFWEPVAKGIHDASEKLKDFNVTVKCIIPKEIQAGGRDAEFYIPVINNLIVNEKIDALALPIFDRKLIPYLNEKIDNGLVVATFNSEPFNFREIIENISNHGQVLFKVSENLAAGSNESSYVTTQINNTMKNILTGTKFQLEKLSETEIKMNSLTENIDKIVFNTNESFQAAQNIIKVTQIGHETVNKSQESIQELLNSSKLTNEIINILNDDTIKIKKFISIIGDIASQTSILAINAAIQAAHAGDEGKGFSVVSSEVSDLAKKTKSETKNIKELIKTILSEIVKATKSITDSMAEVNKSVKIFNNVETAFNDILHASTENEDKIEIINSSVKEIKEVIDSFKNSIISFGKLNRENNTAVETITQSTDEMNQQIQELSIMANQLSDMSKNQEDLISQLLLDQSIIE